MEFKLEGKVYRIEKSQDNRIYAKKEKGVWIYILPEESYNNFINRITMMQEKEEQDRARRIQELRKEEEKIDAQISEVLRIINKRKPYDSEVVKDKKEIKKPVPNKNKKYKGSIKMRVKALAASLLIIGGIGLGAYGINSYIQDMKNKYNQVAASVENLPEDEIRDEIYDILKQEISDATGVEAKDIDILQYRTGSDTETTEVKAGEKVYTEDLNNRDPINFGNTLKSTGIREIISKANNAKTREEFIKTLEEAIRFSKKKDLEVDNNTLKEVKAKDKGEER